MTFPTIVTTSVGSSSSGASSMPTTWPAGITTGDLVIMFVARFAGTTATWPAGWTSLVASSAASAFDARYHAYTSGDTAPTVTGSATQWIYRGLRIAGHDPGTPPEATTMVTGTSTTPNPPLLNPAGWDTEDTLWIAALSYGGSAAPSVYPTNYTNNQLWANFGASTGPSFAMASRALNAASEDPGTFTIGTQAWFANTIAVRPAPAASLAMGRRLGPNFRR